MSETVDLILLSELILLLTQVSNVVVKAKTYGIRDGKSDKERVGQLLADLDLNSCMRWLGRLGLLSWATSVLNPVLCIWSCSIKAVCLSLDVAPAV